MQLQHKGMSARKLQGLIKQLWTGRLGWAAGAQQVRPSVANFPTSQPGCTRALELYSEMLIRYHADPLNGTAREERAMPSGN